MTKAYRYYVRSPDGWVAFGFDVETVANAVALENGVGAAVVDTLAQAYVPMLQEVRLVDGQPALALAPIGGWDTGKFGVDRGRSALAVAESRGKSAAAALLRSRGAL
jgi:hypothetical protein